MKIKNARPRIGERISVVQFRTEYADTFSYITLSEALKRESVEITEVDEAGSVNNLRIHNMSGDFIFLSDGDTLMGAKQNRTLNTSVLLEPNVKIVIPVSCVEAGRWRYKTKIFSHTDYCTPSSFRREKQKDVLFSLQMNAGHRSDQGKVWSNVSKLEDAHGSHSNTSDLLHIFSEKSHQFEKELADIFPEESMNGVAIFYGNLLASVEVFNRTNVYKEYFHKLLRSASIDRVLTKNVSRLNPDDAIEILSREMDKISALEQEQHKAVAAGEEKRFSNDELSVYELDYQTIPIHFAALLNVEDKLDKVRVDRSGKLIVNFGEFKGRRFEELVMIDYDMALNLSVDPEIPDELQKIMFEEISKFNKIRKEL